MSPATAQDIQTANRLFEEEVVARRNVAALDSIYTRDAAILPPGGEMITGLDNIKSFWTGAIAALDVSSAKLETVSFQPLGDGGYEIGRAVLNFTSGAPSLHVKYVVVWKKEDGAWKWHVDIWNPNS